MPAKSKSQQKLFGIARAVQKGKISPSKVSNPAKDIAKNVKKREVKKFADTPTHNLPDRVKKEMKEVVAELVKEMINETPESKKYLATLPKKPFDPQKAYQTYVALHHNTGMKPKSFDDWKKMHDARTNEGVGTEKKYVYGTRDNKWHLVGPEDRDYKTAISQADFKKLGPTKAKAQYLSPSFIRGEGTNFSQVSKLQEKMGRELTTQDKHQLAIAYRTIKMPEAMVGVMGGMTKQQAKDIITRLTGHEYQERKTEGVDYYDLKVGKKVKTDAGSGTITHVHTGSTAGAVEVKLDNGKTITIQGHKLSSINEGSDCPCHNDARCTCEKDCGCGDGYCDCGFNGVKNESVNESLAALVAGGGSIFSYLKPGEKFVFKGAEKDILTKVSNTSYKDSGGKKWSTGRNTAVFRVKESINDPEFDKWSKEYHSGTLGKKDLELMKQGDPRKYAEYMKRYGKAVKEGKVEYKGDKCPKCGNDKHYIMNASTPIINKCTKCGHSWNPDNEKFKESIGESEGLAYIAIYNGKQIEIHNASSLYDAKKKAIERFKPAKSKEHMISVALAKKDGKDVVHTATEAKEPEKFRCPKCHKSVVNIDPKTGLHACKSCGWKEVEPQDEGFKRDGGVPVKEQYTFNPEYAWLKKMSQQKKYQVGPVTVLVAFDPQKKLMGINAMMVTNGTHRAEDAPRHIESALDNITGEKESIFKLDKIAPHKDKTSGNAVQKLWLLPADKVATFGQQAESVNESATSDQAKKLGLDYLSFGRYGKNGKQTHKIENGKLIPITAGGKTASGKDAPGSSPKIDKYGKENDPTNWWRDAFHSRHGRVSKQEMAKMVKVHPDLAKEFKSLYGDYIQKDRDGNYMWPEMIELGV